MKTKQYEAVKRFFNAYTDGFVTRADNPAPFELKIAHTHRVCKNMALLLAAQKFKTKENQVGMTIALLHDIGRFLQYERHGTFNDMQSENHGMIGETVIREEKILSGLGQKERQQIMQAVAVHNAFAVPDNLDPETRQLALLVRDADKIDILNVMADFYKNSETKSSSFITLHLPDDYRISPVFVHKILNREWIDARMVKTVNDLKLLQISWIFDVNFPATLDMLRERGHIQTILSTLPDSGERDRVTAAVQQVLIKKSPAFSTP